MISISASDSYAQSTRKGKNYLKKRSKVASRYTGGSMRFTKQKRYLSVGLSANSLNYFGDLTPSTGRLSTDLSYTRPGFGLQGVYRFNPNLSFRSHLLWGRISADDFESADIFDESGKYRHLRNLHFRNDIYEIGFGVMYDIFPNYSSFLNRVPFTPYVVGGFSIFYHNPKAIAPEFDKNGQPLAEGGQWVALRPLGTEGQYSPHYDVKPYSLIQPSIQLGAGIRSRLSKRVDLEFEIIYRFIFTDYLDDVSGKFVDLGALDSELAKAMSDRSRETNAAWSGSQRDLAYMQENIQSLYTYTSEYDGNTYTVFRGYGHEHPDNNRGFPGNDTFLQISLRFNYILAGAFARAKYR